MPVDYLISTPNVPETSLYIAAKAGDVQQINALHKAGADMNVRSNGKTPLHIAAENGHLAAVDALLIAGADAKAIYIGWLSCWTALDFARAGGQPVHTEIVKALEKHLRNYPNGVKSAPRNATEGTPLLQSYSKSSSYAERSAMPLSQLKSINTRNIRT